MGGEAGPVSCARISRASRDALTDWFVALGTFRILLKTHLAVTEGLDAELRLASGLPARKGKGGVAIVE